MLAQRCETPWFTASRMPSSVSAKDQSSSIFRSGALRGVTTSRPALCNVYAISAPESRYPELTQQMVRWRIMQSIPPGFLGLRTPLIVGGSIA